MSLRFNDSAKGQTKGAGLRCGCAGWENNKGVLLDDLSMLLNGFSLLLGHFSALLNDFSPLLCHFSVLLYDFAGLICRFAPLLCGFVPLFHLFSSLFHRKNKGRIVFAVLKVSLACLIYSFVGGFSAQR
ncbi:hypothetical protein [Candidatus Electrothrix sp.]|uniref:hypothetical protein n=1 Tax=Candidatus Electrothrix sp. TaxID=2170559 RepID=UPI00405765B9